MSNTGIVRYRVTLLRAGQLLLDAGCMLGLIPKVLWQKQVPIDDKNRVTLGHNCLLLERLDDVVSSLGAEAAPSPKLVLIESGSGDKLDEKSRAIFGLDGRTVLTALEEVGCNPADIGAAIPTHLHFDHVGGLTRLARPGEKPDWFSNDDVHSDSVDAKSPLFPFAMISLFTPMGDTTAGIPRDIY